MKGLDPASILEWAADKGLDDIVEFALDAGADPNGESQSALCIAVVKGHASVVRLLISRGTDLRRHDGWTVAIAGLTGRVDIMRELIRNGAYLNRAMFSDDVLVTICCYGHADVLRFLRDVGFPHEAVLAARRKAANCELRRVVALLDDVFGTYDGG